jgi:hypothetical protein
MLKTSFYEFIFKRVIYNDEYLKNSQIVYKFGKCRRQRSLSNLFRETLSNAVFSFLSRQNYIFIF